MKTKVLIGGNDMEKFSDDTAKKIPAEEQKIFLNDKIFVQRDK